MEMLSCNQAQNQRGGRVQKGQSPSAIQPRQGDRERQPLRLVLVRATLDNSVRGEDARALDRGKSCPARPYVRVLGKATHLQCHEEAERVSEALAQDAGQLGDQIRGLPTITVT